MHCSLYNNCTGGRQYTLPEFQYPNMSIEKKKKVKILKQTIILLISIVDNSFNGSEPFGNGVTGAVIYNGTLFPDLKSSLVISDWLGKVIIHLAVCAN